MGHSYSRLSIRKRSLDTPPHGQISVPERPNKRSCLAQSPQLDQPQSPQALPQLEASTSQLRECKDDEEGREKSTGYSSQQVFLSHSGQQKNFVEQLFEDLQNEHISSFFDKDRHSLPKGEEFPPLILQAAQRCKVAVVVLSEDFITSKWPMLELCAFFAAKKTSNPSLKILPLFFELSPAELAEKTANKDVYTSWINSKKPQTTEDTRIDLNAWFEALKALKRTNGEIYNRDEGEVHYRRKIVDDIRRLLPPNLVYEDPFVKGKQRLCQVVKKLFDNTPCGENGVKIAGLYGVSGSGKTTLCKSLCDFFSHEFKRKVFHVELQGRGCNETFKRALQVLAGASETLVNSVISIEHGLFLLKEMMRGKKVFLAIDNISDNPDCIKKAKLYLTAVCSGYESRILLTARSLGVLGRFIPNPESSSMHVPDLEEEEAIGVLLQLTPIEVSDLTCKDKDVARKCIQKCRFTWYSGNGNQYRAYHPLVLKTFGAYLYDKFESCADLSRWIDIPTLSNTRMGPLQKFFCMFEESLKDLSPECLTVFILVCLYLPKPWMSYADVLIWLAFVCDISIKDIEHVIIQLKNKGFIEKGYKLYIHDLFMDFAQCHANGTGKWILLKNAVEIPVRLQQSLSNDRPRFEALKLDNCLFQSLAGINYDLLRNVAVLDLQDMAILKTLDLRPMKMLRSLAIFKCLELEKIRGIRGLSNLCYFIIKGCYRDLQFPGVECLMALRHLEVDLVNSNDWPIKGSPEWPRPLPVGNLPKWEFLECSKLKALRNLRTVSLCCGGRGTGTLDFTECPNLERLTVSRCGMTGLALDGCTRLTTLALQMPNLEELPFPGGLTHLRELDLLKMKKLKRLPGLSQLSNLEYLHLGGMRNLEELPSFQCLRNLVKLKLRDVANLKEIPSFAGLTNLTYLHLWKMPNLKEISSFTGLTNLTSLRLWEMPNLKEIPRFTGFTNLTSLYLWEMPNLKEIPSFTGLINLTCLDLYKMPNLKEIPSFTGLPNLTSLYLREMPNLKEIPSFTGLTNLTSLYLCKMRNLKEIPSFTGLTKLKDLHLTKMPNLEVLPSSLNELVDSMSLTLREMPNLTDIPNLSGLSNLNQLVLDKMEKLRVLPSFAELAYLQCLYLGEIPHLDEVPCLSGLSHLRMLVLRKMENLRILPSFSELTELEFFGLKELPKLREVPCLNGLTKLHEIKLEGIPNLKEFPTLARVTNIGGFPLPYNFSLLWNTTFFCEFPYEEELE